MAASEAAPRIVALGEPMVEFNQRERGQPQYLQGFGGDTSNTAIAAARQGVRAAYITRIGADVFGGLLMALWRAEGVDTTAVGVDPLAPTGVYFVTHSERGHEFMYLRAGSAASGLLPGHLRADWFTDTAFLHVSGISQAISAGACDAVFAAIDLARAAGARVSFDPNLRLRLWPLARARAIIAATLPLADWFLPSEEDLTTLAGTPDIEAQLAWCWAHGAHNIALKRGAHGAVVATDGARTAVPGYPSVIVDATGAGDCFDGSFLARLTLGDDPIAAARYANAAASLAVEGFGAVAPIPRPQQVRARLGAGG
jgi:2-dehydro-3-deoxygluconokinase